MSWSPPVRASATMNYIAYMKITLGPSVIATFLLGYPPPPRPPHPPQAAHTHHLHRRLQSHGDNVQLVLHGEEGREQFVGWIG